MNLQSKKWHKSPHNRFKVSVVFLLCLCEISSSQIATTAASQTETARSAPSQPHPMTQAMPTRTTPVRPEEEVDVTNATRRPVRTRQARVYRIRALADGRLSLPAKLVAGSAPPQTLPPPPPPPQTAVANKSADEFGARTTPPTASNRKSKQLPLEASTQRACNQTTGSDSMNSGASIAASSPMLRLVAPSGTPRPLVGLSAFQNNTEPAHSSTVSAVEVDESADLFGAGSGKNHQDSTAGRHSAHSVLTGLIDDEFDSKMVTNRTKAHLSCDSGEMVLRLNFTEPFRGIVYPDHNRLSPCRFFGDGHNNYELRLPLRGCGTRQAVARVFVNDVIVRFHKTLELEEDEVKTLICRYPPPVAPPTIVAISGMSPAYAGEPQRTRLSSGTSADLASSLFHPAANASASRPQQTEVDARNIIKTHHSAANFELIDPLTGRQRHPTGDTIETMSESLLVEPAGVQKTNERLDLSKPAVRPGEHLFVDSFNNAADQLQQGYGTTLSRLRDSNARLGLSPGQSDHPNGAIILQDNPFDRNGFINQSIASAPISSSLPFFDRLSSIELLFLISSLMFIVLMALGLTGSYYCFQRRRRLSHLAHQRHQSASSMLRAVHQRNHRAAAASNHRHNNLQHYNHHRPQLLRTTTGAPAKAAGLAAQRQFFHQEPYLSNHGHSNYAPTSALINATLSSASSPDSDLSARGHLLGRSSMSRAGDAIHYRQRQQQVPPLPSAGIYLSNTLGHMNRKQSKFSDIYAAPVGGRRTQGSANNVDDDGAALGRATLKQRHHLTSGLSTAKRARQQTSQPQSNQSQARQLGRIYRVTEATGSEQQDAHYNLNRTRSFGAGSNRVNGPSQDDNNKTSQLYRPHHYDGSHSLSRQHYLQKHRYTGKQTSDDEHSDDAKNNNNTAHPNRKSHLVLKSIDDSYVTNITEIVEKEYMERDTTRPLAWSEWRRATIEAARRRANKKKTSGEPSDADSDTTSSDDEQNCMNTLASTAGAMRSLTEVDVDFTRSLLRNPANLGSLSQDKSAPAQHDEDLIISPEYDCPTDHVYTNRHSDPQQSTGAKQVDQNEKEVNKQKTDRVELVVSPTSQDSVSYV